MSVYLRTESKGQISEETLFSTYPQQTLEFQNHMIPTEQVMNNAPWGFQYALYWSKQADELPYGNAFKFWMKFQKAILENCTYYELPVINLEKDTTKEGVCIVHREGQHWRRRTYSVRASHCIISCRWIFFEE